ncbi:MLO-like protein 1 isoform X2 [Nicotiana tabacum]|uniref:MLO-like protein n=1 Tax=Nicotiana tabacum TaxID=4097 RepID=A0A1S3Y025_TOBAC|nr:MLO-like protein 1 isoform X2 [Nicotiana tomentosiformis]XP_016445576.1 PREDICTED: MLO-like protein 1 isoform X2 [Nicotiana tabacum]
MGGGGEDEGEGSLEFTPTWVVAAVCTVIVSISLALERFLHYTGKHLKKKKQKHLYEALQKVKEELMLLGFISLLLTVFQGRIVKFCVHQDVVKHLLPCSLSLEANSSSSHESTPASPHSHHHRHLLVEEAAVVGYCHHKHKVPLLSLEALHHLHIFIFVLATVHVTFSVLTIVFGGAKIRQWKYWEDSIVKDNYESEHDYLRPSVTHVHEHDFIRNRFQGIGKQSAILGWVHSFFKQFYASVNKEDYRALRLGFIMTHCRGNPRFNFHRYMIRALEDDFRTVVGISWYLWIFVILFLLLNINGWHTYFWIAFIPFILLLAVGTKLEHVIIQLAHEIAEKHVAVEGELVVQPSDSHFWFDRPQIVLFLIHFILFQNAFEIAFFFWILFQYGFYSCIMGKYVFVTPRLVIGVFIQVLCSYSTLPLYALVTQMGSHYKKSMFDDHVQACLIEWAEKVKKKKAQKAARDGSNHSTDDGFTIGSPMSVHGSKESPNGV